MTHFLYQGNDYNKSERAYEGTSAAYDLYANYDEQKNLTPTVVVNYGGDGLTKTKAHLIPTGLRLSLQDKRYVAVIKERGSVIKGTPMLLRAGVIDFGYTGEIFVAVDMLTGVTIQPGEKLPFQLMIHYLGDADTEETESLEAFQEHADVAASLRGAGCVGSSDIKN